MGILDFFRNRITKKELNELERKANKIEELENEIKNLNDEQLKNKTNEFKQRYKEGESLDDMLYEAFAVVREASIRTIGLRPFNVQLIGAIVLHEGRIAEMKTGEGKTLVATMPLYLNALTGKGVHLITVNDYLAKYQSTWMGKVFNFLGLSVGCLTNDVSGEERKKQYNCDITYGTNNEYGFDYLRDNMVLYKEDRVQRKLHYAIVDEVDSILIDEARTPLIISGRGTKSTDLYKRANLFAKSLIKDNDVVIDEKAKSIVLSDESGVPKAEKFFSIENIADMENAEIYHHVNQAIRARFIMKKDIDYVVSNSEVIIVDEFTGRMMEGRRYSNGLHQAIEAKEGIEVRKETQTLATITLQNFFRMYEKLAGMTGTAKTEEDEFREIYNMDVVVIPTNKPVIRDDKADIIYGKQSYKYKAIVEEIKRRNELGQPVLVGTVSIETSELLSVLLKREGIKHEVLNAKHHQREAQIIAQAGHFAAVTIATNMAGRGTDIMLGGNIEFLLRNELLKEGYESDIISFALSPFDYEQEEVKKAKKFIEKIRPAIEEEIEKQAKKVRDAGGLHVLGTERHESRRIDLQLRGRSGRQGDPGSSQFFLALDDDLLRIFMKEGVASTMQKIGMGEDVPIQSNILTRSIESAQKKVEANHYGTRRYVLQYDHVMNEQRTFIYKERNRVLENSNLKEHIFSMLENLINDICDFSYSLEDDRWDIKTLSNSLKSSLFTDFSKDLNMISLDLSEGKEKIIELAKDEYNNREESFGENNMRELERAVLLESVDNNWIEHIDAMDNLKQGIGLRAIGQVDPVQAYQMEGFDMYELMIKTIQETTIRYLFTANFQETDLERKKTIEISDTSSANTGKTTIVRKEEKIGRNAACTCGSGKKYKHCCGRN